MSPILESRQQRSLRQVVTSPPRVQRLFTPEAEQAMSQWARRAPHLYTPEQRVQPQEGSSNGSLTQEQVMAEVQKQVRFELRAHEEARQQLTEENQQLKAMLEKVLNQALQCQDLQALLMGALPETNDVPLYQVVIHLVFVQGKGALLQGLSDVVMVESEQRMDLVFKKGKRKSQR
eukprot:s3398_g9.t1